MAGQSGQGTGSIRDRKPIALRFTDPELEKQVKKLSESKGLSLNMTVNMLLGYAFNEAEKQNKQFESKVLFEIK
jgi:hypothetical protein